jgi:YVTN family beta-propeller protein
MPKSEYIIAIQRRTKLNSRQQRTKLFCTAIGAIAMPVISQAQPMVYLADGSNQISVINMATQSVSFVNAPNSPAGLALSPDGTKLYVLSQSNNTVSVFNTATMAAEATLPTGDYPEAVAADPTGNSYYVANQGSNSISIYDATTNTHIKDLSVGSYPSALAFFPASHLLFVANSSSSSVTVISTTTFTVLGTFATQLDPIGLAVSPSGYLYVASPASNTVTVYTTTGTQVAQISGFDYPYAMAVDAQHNTLYVANDTDNGTVTVVNLANNQVVTTIPVGVLPDAVAVSLDGTQIFVANELSFTMNQISASSNTVTGTIGFAGIYPVSIAAH